MVVDVSAESDPRSRTLADDDVVDRCYTSSCSSTLTLIKLLGALCIKLVARLPFALTKLYLSPQLHNAIRRVLPGSHSLQNPASPHAGPLHRARVWHPSSRRSALDSCTNGAVLRPLGSSNVHVVYGPELGSSRAAGKGHLWAGEISAAAIQVYCWTELDKLEAGGAERSCHRVVC